MHVAPPTYPLTVEVFAAALRTGHGRALQQIATHGAVGLEDEVIEACVSSLAYDPQCEEDRAPWLFSLIDQAKLTDRVLLALEAALHQPAPQDHRDMAQWSGILKVVAESGSADARRLLYASLRRVPHTASVIGAEHIVALDGVAGLIHVAQRLGRWLEEDPDFWCDDYFSSLDPAIDIEVARVALERASAVDADVAAFLAGVRKTQEAQASSSGRLDRSGLTGTQIVALIEKNPRDSCHWLRQWGVKAAGEQRELVFTALLASNEPEHVKRLFRCFAKTGLPRFDERLLRWLGHSDEQLRWSAVTALAHVRHVDLRRAALRMTSEGDMASGLSLLMNNFETGDFNLCSAQLKPVADADETHHLVGALLDLCEAHLGPAALGCLLYVYELSPCSVCRRRAVKAMIAGGITPPWVLEESASDADPATRDIVAATRP